MRSRLVAAVRMPVLVDQLRAVAVVVVVLIIIDDWLVLGVGGEVTVTIINTTDAF